MMYGILVGESGRRLEPQCLCPLACQRHAAPHRDSDASYLSEPKASSPYAGYHYLSDSCTNPATPAANNCVIRTPCQILKEVVSSATKAELAGTFQNGKEAFPTRVCLEHVGHPPVAYAYHHRQYHRCRHRQRYCETIAFQSGGHALLLDQ
ncbi:hypothetical protein IV203_004298 [Nitzschia inconspicua]|uniref:Uncharacterized protein n=1 Tax=Nitzschia inconspicua TaxID=303405 RepID=A0A9K3PPJ3_9STRA|nr:hypothetical protein IV203_004298 [Nitzschia inconspicua]